MSRGHCPSLGSFLLFLLLMAPEAWAGQLPAGKLTGPASAKAGLSSLSAEAKASISAALGRDQRAYQAKREGESLRLVNPRHGLRADFTARGVEVQSGTARFRLQLAGLGRGACINPQTPVGPEANANRIEYRRGGLTEWYVNGPLWNRVSPWTDPHRRDRAARR